MADMDVFAAMGIAGFGKAAKKRDLDPARFDVAKRQQLPVSTHTRLVSLCLVFTICQAKQALEPGSSKTAHDFPEVEASQPAPVPFVLSDGDASDDSADAGEDEPEYDPTSPSLSAPPEFPVTHEATLKEHTKVISALALDPSGARVLSGSHDYDCKLWDFGGMTSNTRSFKTWEPAGSYYVRLLLDLLLEQQRSSYFH